jgi:hypothetical protein
LQKYIYVEGGDNSWIYAIDDDREKSKPMTIYDYAYYGDGWFATYDFLLMQVMCPVFFCMDVGVVLVMNVAFVTKMATIDVVAIVLYQVSKVMLVMFVAFVIKMATFVVLAIVL